MPDIYPYDQAKKSQKYSNRAVYCVISYGEQLAPILIFSMMLGLMDISIGMVFKMFTKFPFDKMLRVWTGHWYLSISSSR